MTAKYFYLNVMKGVSKKTPYVNIRSFNGTLPLQGQRLK